MKRLYSLLKKKIEKYCLLYSFIVLVSPTIAADTNYDACGDIKRFHALQESQTAVDNLTARWPEIVADRALYIAYLNRYSTVEGYTELLK